MTIKEVVLDLLQKDIKCRNNDNYLIYQVYMRFGWKTDLKDIAENGNNHFESIRRWRAKWQEINPMLRPSPKVEELRLIKEQDFREEMKV